MQTNSDSNAKANADLIQALNDAVRRLGFGTHATNLSAPQLGAAGHIGNELRKLTTAVQDLTAAIKAKQ